MLLYSYIFEWGFELLQALPNVSPDNGHHSVRVSGSNPPQNLLVCMYSLFDLSQTSKLSQIHTINQRMIFHSLNSVRGQKLNGNLVLIDILIVGQLESNILFKWCWPGQTLKKYKPITIPYKIFNTKHLLRINANIFHKYILDKFILYWCFAIIESFILRISFFSSFFM